MSHSGIAAKEVNRGRNLIYIVMGLHLLPLVHSIRKEYYLK